MAGAKDAVAKEAHSVVHQGLTTTAFHTAPAQHELATRRGPPAAVAPGRAVATATTTHAANRNRAPDNLQSPVVLSPVVIEGQQPPAQSARATGAQVNPLSPTLQQIALNTIGPHHQQPLQQPAGQALAAGGGPFSPSLQIVAGGIRALGGQPDDSDSTAVTCVLTYMCIVVVAIAALLIYILRSLMSQPPEVTSSFPGLEEEETTTHLLYPVSTTKEGDDFALVEAMPLPRRKTSKSGVPRSEDGGEENTGDAFKATAEEGRERADPTTAAASTAASTPDEEQRVVEFVVFGPTLEERV